MSERQGFLLRNGALATCACAIFVLAVLFYATVSGAVERAGARRADALAHAALSGRVGVSSANSGLATLATSVR